MRILTRSSDSTGPPSSTTGHSLPVRASASARVIDASLSREHERLMSPMARPWTSIQSSLRSFSESRIRMSVKYISARRTVLICDSRTYSASLVSE